MTELESRLEKLTLRLDRMGMRVEQAAIDSLRALEEGNAAAGQAVDEHDATIDREEVEIEQECIRLLALYQPAAIDLRTICTVIKVNNDLERMADLAASIGRRVKQVVAEGLALQESPEFRQLKQDTLEIVGRTARMLSVRDAEAARRIIEFDRQVDQSYKALMQSILDGRAPRLGGVEALLVLTHIARALERMGDLCTNIAEDIIFLRTGDIVRHAGGRGEGRA